MQDETDERTTREMRMASRILGERGPLDVFIASRRLSGESWRSWETIAQELSTVTGESFTHSAIVRWATRLSIPLDTRPTDGPALLDHYLNALESAGIKVPADALPK